MPETRSTRFLDLIRRSERGRLKVYLGYGPGVGKTYQMLTEAHRLKQEGLDVVVGLVETHGRAETQRLAEGLETLPRRYVEYRGIAIGEFDLDGCLARRPRVALVDELAHANVPGSRNAKRYQDVQELLAAGIHVITTLNVQHLESLFNTVENLIGVQVRERLPDSILAEADQVVNIDLSPEDLQQRLRDGQIYPPERVATSLENFFKVGNLEQLRELALRELASQIDARRRERLDGAPASAPEQVMVCLSSRGPNSARLLRYGSRLAGRLNRNWYAVYIQTPREEATRIDAATQRLLADTLTLANQLGATVFTFKGSDVAETLVRFAREYRVGQIVIGKPGPIAWWKRLLGRRSVAERLVRMADSATVIVVDVEAEEADAHALPAARPACGHLQTVAGSTAPPAPMPLSGLLDEKRIVIWHEPVTRQQAIKSLVHLIRLGNAGVDAESALAGVMAREEKGSTFLNEGIALPHARIEGLEKPEVALAVTRAGILDADADKPVELVFLLLSPAEASRDHLRLLAAIGNALRSRETRRALSAAPTAESAAAALRRIERRD